MRSPARAEPPACDTIPGACDPRPFSRAAAWSCWSAPRCRGRRDGLVAADETVVVAGKILFQGQGDVLVDLVDEAGFGDRKPRPPHLQVIELAADAGGAGSVSFRFTGVRKGRWALRSFLDRNRNRVLDLSWVGVPAEPWGFHRPKRLTSRAPRFDEVAFPVEGDFLGIEIKLAQ